MKRLLFVFAFMMWGVVQNSFGGSRFMSVYIENISSLHGQLMQAGQVFEVAPLAAAPMMLNMMVPGYSQIERDAPIGLHMYVGEDGQPGVVVDIKPVDTADKLLGALLASTGLTLPEPVDGRFVTENGAAQIHGDRLLISQNVGTLEAAIAQGMPAAMPTVPGVLRMQVEPQNVLVMIDQMQEMMQQVMPVDDDQGEMIEQMMGFYRSALAQIASYETGIGMREDGLEIRSRLTPLPGRALAKIIQSVQSVNPAWIASIEQDHIIGMAAGAYEVPEHVMRTAFDFYFSWLASMPGEYTMDADLLRQMLDQTIETAGSPMFLLADISDDARLNLISGMFFEGAERMLAQSLEMIGSEAYRKSMASSGITLAAEPETRIVDDVKVYRWNIEYDQAAFMAQMEEAGAGAVDVEQLAKIQEMMQSFWSGYDYAATAQGTIFGITDDAGISRAVQLLGAPDVAGTGPDSALLQRVGAPTTPYAVLRFDLLSVLRAVRTFGVETLPPITNSGQGIVYAAWRYGDGVEQVMLIPAADIQSMRQAMESMMP